MISPGNARVRVAVKVCVKATPLSKLVIYAPSKHGMIATFLSQMHVHRVKQSVLLSIVVHSKITRSQHLGILYRVTMQHCHNVKNGKKVISVCSKALNKQGFI